MQFTWAPWSRRSLQISTLSPRTAYKSGKLPSCNKKVNQRKRTWKHSGSYYIKYEINIYQGQTSTPLISWQTFFHRVQVYRSKQPLPFPPPPHSHPRYNLCRVRASTVLHAWCRDKGPVIQSDQTWIVREDDFIDWNWEKHRIFEE